MGTERNMGFVYKLQNDGGVFRKIPERWVKGSEKANAAEGGEECDCGSAPQGDSGIACRKPSHQWAGSLGS